MGSVTKIVFGAATAIKIGVYGTVKGSCTDLGYTKGGVTVEYPRDYYNIEVDQEQGDIDIKLIKRAGILRFSVAEAKLDNLRLALDMPAGALVSDVLKLGTAAQQYVTIFMDAPGPDSGTRELWIPKAVVIGNASHAYVKDGETVVEIEARMVFDTAQTDGEELGKFTDSGVDTTPPTVALSTPVKSGTVVKATLGTVQWTITEAGAGIDQNTIKYGNEDDATFSILNITTPGSEAVVAGSIAYNPTTKVVTFTPSGVWVASDKLLAIVTTGLKDIAGNKLAAQKIEDFSVTS